MQSKPSTKSKQSSTDGSAARGARLRALIRKNLVANPDFPGLYAQVLESEGYNYNEAKDLAIQLQKKLGVYKPERSVPTCSHIMVTGVPCQSPALRGERFCYFHQRMLKGVALPRSGFNHIALLENEEAIQVSIMQVINGLMNGSIDLRHGELILRALNTAVRNSRRVRFNISQEQMVTEVPHYEQEAEALDRAREEVRAEVHRMRAEAAKQLAEQAEAQKAKEQEKDKQKDKQKEQPQPPAAQAATAKESPEPAANVAKPKPPLGVKSPPAQADRKIAARASS